MGINVLSLFDGMSCGMIAFKESEIDVDRYVAYEIDEYAIQTSKHNFPEIEQCGDVFKADFKQYAGFDFVVGGSPCFTKGHYVLTDNGYIDISEIKVGDVVLTHTGNYKPVIRTNVRQAETYELSVMGYPKFTTTANHPFYAIKREKSNYAEYVQSKSWRKFGNPQWVECKDLDKSYFCGQHIGMSNDVNEFKIDKEMAYILGRYVADGHIRKTKRKNRKNSYQYQVILSIGKDKLDQFKSKITAYHFSCYPHTQSVYRCIFSSMDLLNFIESKNFGLGAYNKNIPEFIFNLPIDIQKAFLEGYIDGDGCYVESAASYTLSTVSPKLAFGLQRLITSMYHTNVSVRLDPIRKPHKIDGRVVKQNYPTYTILFKSGIRKQSVVHIQDNIIWTQVKSVNPTGDIETVYNIEVADDNSYTVNNCIVHNCTYWSIARTSGRETTASGLGWDLFSQYVRAIEEVKPKYFIYENNYSMSNEIRAMIDKSFGFGAVMINSALVSAQNRERLYWVGVRQPNGKYKRVFIPQPQDLHIYMTDILDTPSSCCMRYERSEDAKRVRKKYEAGLVHHGFRELHELHPRPDGKSNTLSTVLKDNPILTPINLASDNKAVYYKQGMANFITNPDFDATGVAELVEDTNRIGTMPLEDGSVANHRQDRIYSVEGKSCVLTTSFNPNYAIEYEDMDIPEATKLGHTTIHPGDCVDMSMEGSKTRRGRNMSDKSTSNNFYQYLGKLSKSVYEVKDGFITVKGRTYPIKLQDGKYIIRKLSVNECKKLQTIPDWYEFPCSDSQATKMIGNGWTINVIKYLIKCVYNNPIDSDQGSTYVGLPKKLF